ncbi:TonB-dependent receptor plug domain-containing protein [Pseudemcibacter aquimaris]|uniref:TonB-dependent receptor plug domain-containing protein n=1 Tax=Pseudemcibacter aquimaris TaxID=2857064 RepID=UPI0020131111|nr:TonB-dependent receptor [Pseudemcibacter aquimaris]MCC3860146.1 TonB-dependent receptor [Pseudemcibacter aquimaris]WDU57473.1 TonB-dependent receptor [Pseudemcibacter aquimaris]
MKRLTPLSIYASVLLGSWASANDTLPDTDLTNYSIEELLNIRTTVSTLTPQTAMEAPSSVTVYTRQEIMSMGVDTVEDLLNFIPGAYTNRSDALGKSAIFRGRSTGPCGNGVLFLLDNVAVNDSVCGGAAEGLPFMSVSNIEQIEVIRGPGSAIYGSGALYGVVNIISRKDSNNISASYGSFYAREVSFQNSAEWETIKSSISGKYFEDDGEYYEPFFNHFGELNPTKDPVKGFDGALNLDISGLQLNGYFFYRRMGEFVAGGAQGDLSGKQRTDTHNVIISARYPYQVNPKLTIEPYADFKYFQSDFRSLLFPASAAADLVWTNGAEVDAEGGNYREGKDYRIGFSANWEHAENHTITMGANFKENSIDRNSFQGNWDQDAFFASDGVDFIPGDEHVIGFFGGYGLPLNPDEYYLIDATSQQIIGTYLQSQWRPTDNLSITSGIRYDDHKEIGSKISLRGGVVYKLTDDTTVKGLFGQAFRAPTIAETDSEIATNAVGNPNLNPEHITTFEASISQRFGKSIFTITWFRNELSDVIKPVLVEDIIEGFNAFQAQNLNKITNTGWEAEALFNPVENVTLKVGGSIMNNADEVGVAEKQAFWVLNYNLNQWNFNINGFYRSGFISKLADGNLYPENINIDAFTHFNAKLSYQVNDNVQLYVKANNLFDKYYKNFSYVEGLENGTPLRGLSAKFGMFMTY